MKKGSVIEIRFLALIILVPWCVARGQELQFQDIPPSGFAPDAVRKAPLSPESRKALEESLNTHDFQHAESILVKEIDRSPESPELLTLAGAIFFLDGKYLNAAIAMNKADALAALDDRSRFTLAMAYVTLNHRDWARPELEKLTHSDPVNALYPYWLSRLDYDAMNFNGAVTHAKKALVLNPDFMKAFDELGLCYEALGKYDEAIAAYQNAERLNAKAHPCSLWPSLDFGTLLIKLDRLAEAEGRLKQSLACDSRSPRGHYQMGLLLEKEKKDDQAVVELKQAAAQDPAYAEPYYHLGRIYQRQGDPQKAEVAWETFQKLKRAQSKERPH